MRPHVDLATQDPFRTGDDKRGHPLAQLLAGARHLLLDLRLRRRLLAIAFLLGGAARLVDELRGALFRLPENFRAPRARLVHRVFGLALGKLE